MDLVVIGLIFVCMLVAIECMRGLNVFKKGFHNLDGFEFASVYLTIIVFTFGIFFILYDCGMVR